MDKKLIEQYGEEILSYRLRTARQKKRMQYEDFDKQLLRLHRESNALYKQEREVGWEPLLPPVQKGWKRFFVLREDVAINRHAAFYEALLPKINTIMISYRKDFLVKRRKFGRKVYVVKEQKLLHFYDFDFFRRDFTEAERQLFDIEYSHYKNQVSVRYVFKEPWCYILRVQPNMIDRVRKKEALELKAQQLVIHDYLQRNAYQGRHNKLVYGHNWSFRNKPVRDRERYAFNNKSLSQILDLIND